MTRIDAAQTEIRTHLLSPTSYDKPLGGIGQPGLLQMSQPKKPLSIRLDADVLEWLKSEGSGYQIRINAILRVVMSGWRPPPLRAGRSDTLFSGGNQKVRESNASRCAQPPRERLSRVRLRHATTGTRRAQRIRGRWATWSAPGKAQFDAKWSQLSMYPRDCAITLFRPGEPFEETAQR